jgi:hypothetical protein
MTAFNGTVEAPGRGPRSRPAYARPTSPTRRWIGSPRGRTLQRPHRTALSSAVRNRPFLRQASLVGKGYRELSPTVVGPLRRTGDPILTIDEPAARTSACIHALPHIGAAQHTDGNEATRCRLWRYEVWLLADCWRFRRTSAQESMRQGHRVVGAPGTVECRGLDGSVRAARRPSPVPRPRRRRVGSAVPVPAGGRLGPPRPARGPAGRPAAGGQARRSGQPTS